MKRLLSAISSLIFIVAILFTNANNVLASGEDGGHLLEMDVNGYHIALSSQNEWVKGENTVVVTLTDGMGMPVSNADVEILIAPKSDEHNETDAHGSEQQDSMPGMDMGAPAATEAVPDHEEEATTPIPMLESAEHGMYMVQTSIEASGEHDVQVFFHVNGKMMQADFVVDVPGVSSKSIILWGFVMVNVGLVISAGMLKKQPVLVKGGK